MAKKKKSLADELLEEPLAKSNTTKKQASASKAPIPNKTIQSQQANDNSSSFANIRRNKTSNDIAPVRKTSIFSDDTKQAVKNQIFDQLNVNKIKDTWSDGYQFGDVTKTILNVKSLFNPAEKITSGFNEKANNFTIGMVNDIKEGKNNYIKTSKGIQEAKNIWSDGYDFGDISRTKGAIAKTILGTGADVTANLAKGELQTAEGLVDTSRYIISDIAKATGNKEYSKNVKERAIQNTTGYIFGENDLYNNPKDKGWLKRLDEYSVIGNQIDNVVQSLGQQAFRFGLQGAVGGIAGKAGMTQADITKAQKIFNNVEIFAGAYGSAKSDAYTNGADDSTATLRGLISGTAEYLSEHLDENRFLKTGSVTNVGGFKSTIIKGVEKAFGSENMGRVASGVFSSEGEAFEERLSNILETLGTDAVNYFYSDYNYGMKEGEGLDKNASAWQNVKKLLEDAYKSGTSEESKESANAARWSTLLTFGLAQVNTNINKNQAVEAVAKDNNISKEQASKIYDAVLNARTNEITDEKTARDEYYTTKDNVSKELSQSVQNGDLNLVELNKLYNDKQKLTEAVGAGNVSSAGLNLVESYKAYNGEKKYTKEITNIQKFMNNRNIEARFDATMFDNNEQNAIWTTQDGKDNVIFNPNASADQVIQNIATHEMTHDIINQKTEAGTSLFNDVLENIKSQEDYATKRAEIEDLYAKYYDRNSEDFSAKVDEEMVANELGKNLGTQEYINRLVNEKPNLAKRIYNWVVDKLDNIGKSDEYKQQKAYWKSVADKFEVAYNEQKTATGEDKTAYSMGKHYGDLGKGNDTYYTNMSGSRGTGHFGTGTYFVNEEYQPGETSSYANRPSQKVEFDDYNLFKPATETDGFTLHDGLKAINSKVIFEENMINEFESALNKYNDTLTEESLNDLMNLLEKNDYQVDDIQKLFDEGNSTQAENRLIDRVEDIIDNYDTRIRDYSRMVDVLVNNTDLTRPQIQEAFVKARNKLSEYNKAGYKYGQYPTAKVDSLSTIFMKELGYNGIDVRGLDRLDNTTYGSVIYDLDNKKSSPRYSLSPTNIDDKINQSMTMNEAKKMIDIAFKENQINDWMEDNEKYRDADDWLEKVGTDEVAMYIENGYSTITNYLNPLYDRDNSFGDDYVLEDILEAYKNGTLTGGTKQQANRLDLTKTGDRLDTRFYSPQNIENIQEVYNIANERVNNNNRDDVYKARGQFVILAHNQENIDNLGLDRQELNKKLKSWAVYSNKALELSNRLNKNVDRNNQWAGLENSSIINTASISNEELGSLVKNIDGDSSEWQRHYITSTMLALDTHIDYKDLSFQFDANQELNEKNALGDYSRSTKTIRIGRGYQNTVAHEMGHYLDNKWAEDFGFLSTSNLTDRLNFESANVSNDVKQFAKNFNIFMDDLVKSATAESSSNVAYYQDRGEIFARFVGRFVEWTKNTASDGRFGYEDKYYKDNFNQSQYEEFVKLLQEKSMLDTTNQTYNKYSLNLDIDTASETPGTRTTMGELFDRNIAPIREDLSNITEQMNNLSNQIETLQNQLETTPQGYVETYNEQRNENIPTKNLTEADANTLQDALMQDEGYLKSLDEQANQTTNNTQLVDKLTNEVTRRLDLEKGQKETLRNIINESIEKGYSADELSYALYKEFSESSYEMTNQEAVDARRLIRDMPIKVSDSIKTEIPDYGKWKQSNFGKINFSNRGGPVDTVYMELSEKMPYYFPSDIINPTEQLLQIAEVANMATKTTETIDIDPDEFDDIADYIVNTQLEDEYNSQMNSQYDLEKNIQFDMNEDIVPTTIRTQDSIDDYIENRDIAPVKPDRTQQRAENRLKRSNAWRSFREKITNRNAVIDDYAKATGNKQIKFTGDMLNSVSGEVQYNIYNRQTDINGKTIGKSINEIFEPSKKAGLYQVFNDYLFNKSNIERHRVGKGSQVPEAVSQQLVNQYEQQYPEVKKWAKDVYKYYDNVLQEQVNAGLITQEQYNNYRGEDGIYRSYTPFYTDNIDSRYFDNEGKIKPVSTLKRSKGNASDVSQLLSMEDAMAKQTYAYKRAIRQNELFKEIVSASEKYSDAMDMDVRDNPTNLNDSLYTTPEGDKVVTAYINGEKVSAKISDELFNELSGDNEARIKQFEEDFSIVTNPLQRLSGVRRNLLTTWNPTFLARNAIKDIQDAVINSKHTAGMLKNYIPGIKELSSAKTQTAQQFLALYGADNLYGDYSNISKGKKAINKFTRLNELIELAPRFAEFKASLQAGDSVQEAIYNAREVTTNFGRGGYITKALNRNGFTFLNANVQGLSKLVRNLSGENGAKGVASVVVKGALFAVAPSIINHLLYGLDDDKDEEYEAIPDYIKDNYYLVKTEGNNFVRIPKGRINAVFGSLARRMIEAGEGEGFDFKEWGENAWNQIGVGDSSGIQTIFTPLRQAFGSKNGEAWYGGDIVPTRLQNKPAGEQTDAKIDAVSNFIGENLGISPYKINYVLDQYSGGIGDVLLPYITPETKNGAETFGEHLVAPIKDAFVVNSTDDNKYAGDFYDLKDKLEIQSNSEKATDDDKIKYKYMSEVSKQMGELYKEKREVQADTTLGNKVKYEKVQKIQNEINSLAKEGLSTYQSANTTENYSEIGDTEYYKNAKNEWTKVNEDEQEFTAGLNTAEKDSYFKAKNKIYGITQEYSNKLKGLDKDDPSKPQIYADKKEDITKAIVNSGLDNQMKAMVYSKYYSNQDTMTNVVNAGYDVDTYITALNDIDQLRTKYSKKNGYTTEQRKQKTIAYINSLNMEIPQKAMMIRNYYTSFRSYNNDIVNYVANLNISYEDKKAILEGTGMTVNGNSVSWK